MKYRHAFHAGNFADVLKHVTLLALLRSLTRKDKGLLLLDTHAGRGLYDLAGSEASRSGEAAGGVEALLGMSNEAAAEITDYLRTVSRLRRSTGLRHAYPGSPLVALAALRAQDRLVLIETQAEEHAALRQAVRDALRAGVTLISDDPSPLSATAPLTLERITIECADGYTRLAAWLPPIERRALVLIDPPYEDTAGDFQAVGKAAQDILRRLANAVIALWYPIKQARDTELWRQRLIGALPPQPGGGATPCCALELWLQPRDNRIGLNGSGLLIINPPWQFAERAREWLPVLHARLDPRKAGGWSVS